VWKVGFSEVDVTPPLDLELWGYAGRISFVSRGVHDPLKAHALALSLEGNIFVLVSVDIGAVPFRVVRNVRERLRDMYGLPEENVMIAATHTHSGPAVTPLRRAGEAVDENYVSVFERKIFTAAKEAIENLSNGTIYYSKGVAENLSFDRRRKSEPADKEVIVISFFKNDKAIGFVVNFPCHPVCLGEDNLLVSADYPQYLYATLKKVYGENTGVLFLTGACGDIDPVWRGRGYRYAERMGRAIAGEVIKIVETSREEVSEELKATKDIIELDTGQLPDLSELIKERDRLIDEISRLRREFAVVTSIKEALELHSREAFLSWTLDAIKAVEKGYKSSKYLLEIHVAKIGDLYLVGLSGETFAEIGVKIKDACGGKAVVVSYANGDIGYLPTDEAIREGGYEVENAFKYYKEYPYPPKESWEKKILETVSELVSRLK